MKIVVLDRFLAKILYLDVDDAVIENDDVEGWLRRKGYDPKDYPFFRTVDAQRNIEVEYTRVVKNDLGCETHTECKEYLRFGSPYYREKDLKRREHEECIAALKKYGDEEDGGFEKHFEADKPIVAGYLYDEPCDIVVNAVRTKDGDVYVIGYDKNDPSTEQEISADELFAGQLNEITERI